MALRMLLSKLFDRFVAKSPISVMARSAMEFALAPDPLDELFAEHAEQQYTRDLLLSSISPPRVACASVARRRPARSLSSQ